MDFHIIIMCSSLHLHKCNLITTCNKLTAIICESCPTISFDSSLSYDAGSCGLPPTPKNGYRRFTGITEGHTVFFSCNNGYVLSGHRSHTCLSSGHWSGNAPSCIREYYLDSIILYIKLRDSLQQFINGIAFELDSSSKVAETFNQLILYYYVAKNPEFSELLLNESRFKALPVLLFTHIIFVNSLLVSDKLCSSTFSCNYKLNT